MPVTILLETERLGLIRNRLLESKGDLMTISLPDAADFRAVWLETTKSKHQHGGKGWEFGTCLWSPVRNKRGARSYQLMKEPRVGDLVLHNYDYIPKDASNGEPYFCGHSRVAGKARQISTEPPQSGDWSGMGMYYRIELGQFEWLTKPLRVKEFLEYYEDKVQTEILHEPKFFPFCFRKDGRVRFNQGMYLTRVTPGLYELLGDALGLEVTKDMASDNTMSGHQLYAEARRMLKEQKTFLRNPALARDAKKRDGYKCAICDFSPSLNYGQPHLTTALECHHLSPLAERGDRTLSHSTLQDVVTVCSNCHRLLHSKRKVLSPDEARRLLVAR